MSFLDGPFSNYVGFTIDDEPAEPPAGGFVDSDWSDYATFTIDPQSGWTDSDWSEFEVFTIDAGRGQSGWYIRINGEWTPAEPELFTP